MNKRTLERRALMAAVRASGESPLAFFTQLLRNEENPFDLRFAAARELLPFMHLGCHPLRAGQVDAHMRTGWKPLESCSAMIEAPDGR